MTSTTTTSSSFTCASCRVLFASVEEQRNHYQSEWHRYNLRRKVADRPPVTEAIFHSKVQSATSSQADAMEAQKEAAKSRECLPCRKTFASAAAFENHVNSKKHIEATAMKNTIDTVVRIIEPTSNNNTNINSAKDQQNDQLISLPENPTDAEIDAAIQKHLENAKDRLKTSDCLFCPGHFDSTEEAINHMNSQHSFYIPDLDYLTDLEGLMRHLADKVSVWHSCLFCGNEAKQPFPSLEAVRRHMLDKGHNKIRFDDQGSSELADYFDHSALEFNDQEDLDDFVTDNEDEFPDGFAHDALILAPDESELVLPNGMRLGSRIYRPYYRQYLMPYLDDEPRPNSLRPINAPRPDGTIVRGQHHVPQPKPLDQIEKRGIKQEQVDRRNLALKMGVKNNGLQHHYREQLLQ
jgi:pre-60S factor REI1